MLPLMHSGWSWLDSTIMALTAGKRIDDRGGFGPNPLNFGCLYILYLSPMHTADTPTRLISCRVESHRCRSVCLNSQLAHDHCRRIWYKKWKLNMMSRVEVEFCRVLCILTFWQSWPSFLFRSQLDWINYQHVQFSFFSTKYVVN